MQKYLYKASYPADDYYDEIEGGRFWKDAEGEPGIDYSGGHWTSKRFATRYTQEDITDCDIHNWPPNDGEGYGHWVKDGIDTTLRGEIDPVYVAVYSIGQAYGGPEEGGWWVTVGGLEKVVICSSLEEAEKVREELREEFPKTGKYSSVLGGEDYDIEIHENEFPPLHFPEVFPRYC